MSKPESRFSPRGVRPKALRASADPVPPSEIDRSELQRGWEQARVMRERGAGRDTRIERELGEALHAATLDQLIAERHRLDYWKSPPTPDERLATLLELLAWFDPPIDIRSKDLIEAAPSHSPPEGMSPQEHVELIRVARLASIKTHYPSRGADIQSLCECMSQAFPGIDADVPRGTVRTHATGNPIDETIERTERERLAAWTQMPNLNRTGETWRVMLLTDAGRSRLTTFRDSAAKRTAAPIEREQVLESVGIPAHLIAFKEKARSVLWPVREAVKTRRREHVAAQYSQLTEQLSNKHCPRKKKNEKLPEWFKAYRDENKGALVLREGARGMYQLPLEQADDSLTIDEKLDLICAVVDAIRLGDEAIDPEPIDPNRKKLHERINRIQFHYEVYAARVVTALCDPSIVPTLERFLEDVRQELNPASIRQPLSKKAIAVYEMLLAKPEYAAMTGPEILDDLAKRTPPIWMDQSTLTTHILPELEPYGVVNRKRVGYYVLPNARPPSGPSRI